MTDINDTPIVTAEENKELSLLNEGKKAKLKVAKENLAEVQQNIRLLAPNRVHFINQSIFNLIIINCLE